MDSSKSARRQRALEIFTVLEKVYPQARVHLEYRSPFELLVATILAAQCTDERVNTVTPELFRRYPDPERLAKAEPPALEELIRSTGFFRNKAKSLLNMAGAVRERFGGKLPGTVEALTELPGVGRKTANVVAGNCYGVPAIIVDTHFKRVVTRLQLTDESNPDKIEMSIREIVPPKRQTRFSLLLNEHGRRVCTARRPGCSRCPIRRLCPYPEAAT